MSKPSSQHINRNLQKHLRYIGDISLKDRARYLINNLDAKKGEVVGDFGCGDGYYLHLINSLDPEVKLVGVDTDPIVLGNAKSNLMKNKINLIRSDLHKLPFKDSYFDKIILTEVLEHVEDDLKVLKEIYRVLKKGGLLIITVPNYNFPFLWDPPNWIAQRLFKTHINIDFWSGIWAGHKRLYCSTQLRERLEWSDFKVEDLGFLTMWCLPFNHHIVNLVARFLYDFKPSTVLSDPLSKFKTTNKSPVVNILFDIIDLFDKLNTYLRIGNGVSIYAKATK